MIPLEPTPKPPEGYTPVNRETRKQILSALSLALNWGEFLAADCRTIMTQLHQELWAEALSTGTPPEWLVLSPGEFNVATLALIIQAGFSFVPVTDVAPTAHVMRRSAAAGLLSLNPLHWPEDKAARVREEVECIQYQLRELGVHEVKAKR